MPTEIKLTKQSEIILEKLSEELKTRHGENPLTEEEVATIRKGLTLYEGFGVFGNIVVKAAAFIIAALTMWNFVLGKKQ